ncbi:signal peptidase II [Trinickia soli]|uniref:Lipoprotein signal peptidase n=1 Tax=Trinickia soli TaxID=380675 RepID=A0A2N7VGF8_9BURK|nr:signal peptidase II [Trinickia soli]PMS16237.1 signal peptidase II [Trinickia soli]CAB3728701.1 Lipoprotein signal peptidase [Trinickia soli]
MARSRSMQASGASLAPWLGISLIVILFDQLTKIAVTRVFSYATPYVVTPFFNFLLIFNRGAAFSFLSSASGWQRWAFTGLGVVAACVIVSLLKRHGNQRLFCTALSLIMGGALGNVIDRIVHGRVIDFLDFHVGNWHWPAFNLADSAIVIGAMLLVLDELRRVRGTR